MSIKYGGIINCQCNLGVGVEEEENFLSCAPHSFSPSLSLTCFAQALASPALADFFEKKNKMSVYTLEKLKLTI